MRCLRNCGAMVVAGLMVAGFAQPAVAQSPAITGVSGSTYSNNTWTWGWEFTVGSSDITVTHLGTYDRSGDGFVAAHEIGIWAVSDQSLLVSTQLLSGTVHPLESGFRWKELDTPITLLANTTYRIGDEPKGDAREDMLTIPASSVTMDPHITLGGRVTNNTNSFSYPYALLNVNGATIGPNFKFFGPTAVPEPAFLQLPFLMGLGGAGWWWRRRRTE